MVKECTKISSFEHEEQDRIAPFAAELVSLSTRIRHHNNCCSVDSSVPQPATDPILDSCSIQLPRPPTWKTRRRVRGGMIGFTSVIALVTGGVVAMSRSCVQEDQAGLASKYDAEGSKATTPLAAQLDGKRCADFNGEGCVPMGKRELRDLVHDCARGLEVPPGGDCSEQPIGNSYRVPFMKTTGNHLPCNFEVCSHIDVCFSY